MPPTRSTAETSSASTSRGWRSWQRPDLDVSEREHAVVVALDGEVAGLGPPVVGPVVELAGLHLRLPIRAPQFVLHDLLAVEPVLDVGAARDDARRVPLANGLQEACRRGVQPIGSGGRR